MWIKSTFRESGWLLYLHSIHTDLWGKWKFMSIIGFITYTMEMNILYYSEYSYTMEINILYYSEYAISK